MTKKTFICFFRCVYLVSHSQTDKTGDDLEFYGITSTVKGRYTNRESKNIIEKLKECVDNATDEISAIRFPNVSEEPTCEYTTQRLLADTYPWLFPGGVGDIIYSCNDETENIQGRLNLWNKMLHRWKDGRFMKDDLFTFHITNIIQRRCNNTFALNFKTNILSRSDITVEEIKNEIERGDMSFLEKLIMHSGSKIKGSDSFWRHRKHEVESWITHNIRKGIGPPTLFLTFSCAEYWWSDLCEMLAKRLQGTEDEFRLHDMIHKRDKTIRCYLIDKYSAIVQEFFQIKMDNWLETVGRKVFRINSYFLRFEFTKGRGQIHAHILACTMDYSVMLKFGSLYRNDPTYATRFIADFVRHRYDLSCEMPRTDKVMTRDKDMSYVEKRFIEIEDMNEDKYQLCICCHMHVCNKFCLKYKSKR